MVQSDESQLDPELIRRQLDRVLASNVFSAAKRSRMFLRYIVERTLLGTPPKELEIAVEVLGRAADYDPDRDATVRVEISRLRSRLREYNDTAGKDDPVYINIPKGAYRAVFDSGKASQVASASATERFSPPPALITSDSLLSSPQAQGSAATNLRPPEAQSQTAHLNPKWWIGIVVVGVLVLITLRASRRSPQTGAPIHSLAVLPLKDLSGTASEEYFVDGMTDALITELAHTLNLRVVSRTSVMQEKGSRKPLRQIASALRVDTVIEGSVVRSGNRVRVTAQLIDARDDRTLWAQSYEEPIGDILTLQDKVVRQIALQTQAALAPRRESIRSRRLDPAAYDSYLRGLYFLNQRNVEKSVTYFQQAVALDSSYAAANAGLAEALATRSVGGDALLDDRSRALATAKRAIELDGESGEAYAALGLAEIVNRDWTAAGRDLEKGIALNPSNSLAEMHYAIYLDAMARPEDAVSHMRRALELDPLSFLMNRHLGATLYFARHYQEALWYLQRAEELEPAHFGYVEPWIARCYEMTLHFEEAARADLGNLSAAVPDARLAHLRQAYRHGGWNAYQRARINLIAKNPNACDSFEVGESYLRLGDSDRALSWLGRGVKEKCFWADSLPVDPILDGIRSNPRFSALLQLARLGKNLQPVAN